MPEVQAGLEALTDGTTAREPVRSRFGWHILRLHRRIAGRTLEFDMVRTRIADMLEARSWSVEAARYVAEVAARNRVEGVTDWNAVWLIPFVGYAVGLVVFVAFFREPPERNGERPV